MNEMNCHGYFRKWLDIPVSGTVEILQLSKAQFGQEVIDASTKHILCQVTFRKCLKNSINEDIRYLHNATSEGTNIQYDSLHTSKLAPKKDPGRQKIEGRVIAGSEYSN